MREKEYLHVSVDTERFKALGVEVTTVVRHPTWLPGSEHSPPQEQQAFLTTAPFHQHNEFSY